jgi:uncharacterized membrane protein YqjE
MSVLFLLVVALVALVVLVPLAVWEEERMSDQAVDEVLRRLHMD